MKPSLILAQFIPFLLVLLYALFPFEFMTISNNILGKFLLLCIVLFYTLVNRYVGTFVGLLFILYYQSDVLEGFEEIQSDNGEVSEDVGIAKTSASAATSVPTRRRRRRAAAAVEGFLATNETNYQTLYKKTPVRSDAAENFAKQQCVNGKIIGANNLEVKTEMIQHIFPEIQFEDVELCNPCDRTCRFSVIESKLDTEEIVALPKSSNSWYDQIIQSIIPTAADAPPPRGSAGPISETFSLWRDGAAKH